MKTTNQTEASRAINNLARPTFVDDPQQLRLQVVETAARNSRPVGIVNRFGDLVIVRSVAELHASGLVGEPA